MAEGGGAQAAAAGSIVLWRHAHPGTPGRQSSEAGVTQYPLASCPGPHPPRSRGAPTRHRQHGAAHMSEEAEAAVGEELGTLSCREGSREME